MRKQFNARIKKLEALRLQLATWKEAMPALHSRAERELRPLEQAIAVQQRALLMLFDQASKHATLSEREQASLSEAICETARAILADHDDPEVTEIYQQHSGSDGVADVCTDDDAFRAMVETALGAPLEDGIDARSPEALLAAMAAQMQRHAEQSGRARQRTGPRPPSASALARQAAEALKLKQSVRDIYRKLVSQLHPDRERDPTERARKTALMQRVNVANAVNDLLALLELQLEVEQIDQAGLDRLSVDQIKQYVKILDGQLCDIAREIDLYIFGVSVPMGAAAMQRPTPRSLETNLNADIARARRCLNAITVQLENFQDVKRLKMWLRRYQPAPRFGIGNGYWL